jgi:hypothetical protein
LARVHLVSGLVVQPFFQAGPAFGGISSTVDAAYYEEHGWSLPRAYPLFRTKRPKATVSVCFWNTGHGVFAIRSSSRRVAYDVVNALWGFATLAYGFEPMDGSQQLLYELDRMPDPSWSDDQLLEALARHNRVGEYYTLNDLTVGPALEHHRLVAIRDNIGPLLEIRALHESLQHLRASRQLFHGHMVGSYYELHYARDRRETHWRQIERSYYEQKTLFELAFVSAFKAIERLLGANHFRASDIRRLVTDASYLGVTPSTRYRRFHEIFRGFRKFVTVEEMVRHLLILRNATAAHANSTPPRHLMLSEDNVYEIQNFVGFLVGEALEAARRSSSIVTYEPRTVAALDKAPAIMIRPRGSRPPNEEL